MLTEPPGGALARTSTYTLPTEQPGWIDLTTSNGDPSKLPSEQVLGRPLHTKAIYQIEANRLTYCVAPPGQPRPTEFVTKKGDSYTLVSLKRLQRFFPGLENGSREIWMSDRPPIRADDF